MRRPTVRVALVALVVIVAQWVDTRMQVSGLQHEVARRSADVDATAKAGRAQLQQMQEALAAQQAKVGVLEARLAETQSQAVALEAMYQELSSSRDERLLAEVEQAVVIAMQQLQFSGNVEAALIALQGAEARLGRSVQPQFLRGIQQSGAIQVQLLELDAVLAPAELAKLIADRGAAPTLATTTVRTEPARALAAEAGA